MIPKRKLIKKLRSKQKLAYEQTQAQNHQSILQKLKSINPALKEQAVTILANLYVPMPYFLEPEFVRELVTLLYQGNQSLVCQTIFAMANLCEIQPAVTRILFEQGLDKALVTLPSTNNNDLLKPILVFFITVCETLPKKYHYLLQGIRNSLTVEHFKHCAQLCLQFLFRTSNQTLNKLSEPIINCIIEIYKTTESVTEKSYSVAVISKQLQGNKQVEEILSNYMTELLVCIDLAKEYEMNFAKTLKKTPEQNLNKLQQENHEDVMEEDHEDEKLEKVKKFVLTAADRQKLKFFNHTIAAMEILLEFILDVLEKDEDEQWQGEDDEDQQDDEQMTEEKNKNQTITTTPSTTKQLIFHFIKQNMSIFPKFLSLSSVTVPDTENIVYLFYHLLMHTDKHLQTISPNNLQNLTEINQLIQVSLQNLFATIESARSEDEDTAISVEQYETLVQCLQIGLGVLMKNKGVAVGEDWLIGFGKSFMMAKEVFGSVKLLEQLKPCWLIMLELYSKVLNPEKNPNITPQQNYALGEILKHLVISLPYNELQEFRCQVIDTIFDVYSNQKFDEAFVQLGFFELLDTIVKKGHSLAAKTAQTKGKGKGSTRKQQKFIQDVLKDVKRFLDYKHKMIKN